MFIVLISLPKDLKMTSSEEFREFGKAMIDYVADYLDNIRDRPVLPKVNGYITLQ